MSGSECPETSIVSPSVCVCGTDLRMIDMSVRATTGNVFNLRVALSDSLDYVKKIIAKKAKMSKDRIVLLYRERELKDGTLEEHSVADGSKLNLVPSVETGLLSQRPEQSVMQALESLNDSQVTDFLSGKAPLNLTMRLGDHMMLIQLQLSTVSPVPSVSHHSRAAAAAAHQYRQQRTHQINSKNISLLQQQQQNHQLLNSVGSSDTQTSIPPPSASSIEQQLTGSAKASSSKNSCHQNTHNRNVWRHRHQQSSHHYHPYLHPYGAALSSQQRTGSATPPVSLSRSNVNLPTSDLPPRVCCHSLSDTELDPLNLAASHRSLGGRMRGISGVSLDTKALAEASRNLTQTLRQLSSDVLTNKTPTSSSTQSGQKQPSRKANPDTAKCSSSSFGSNLSSNKSKNTSIRNQQHKTSPLLTSTNPRQLFTLPKQLAQPPTQLTPTPVTSHLTQSQLNALSSLQLPINSNGQFKKPSESNKTLSSSKSSSSSVKKVQPPSTSSKVLQHAVPQGAIIESMQHHGKGVFSGTFSGTLNPALQDRHGRPKRDISTIIHILNDLLCATPHYATSGSQTTLDNSASRTTSSKIEKSSVVTTGETKESSNKATKNADEISPEEAASRIRFENVVAMVTQRAEKRRARRLAKTTAASAPLATPYSIPEKKTTPTVLDNKDSNLMVTQSSVELDSTSDGSVEMHQHSIEQVENTYVTDSIENVIEEQQSEDVCISSPEELKSNVRESSPDKVVEKMEVDVNKDDEEMKPGSPDQQPGDDQEKKSEQSAKPENEQDAAKMVSLSSGAVVA